MSHNLHPFNVELLLIRAVVVVGSGLEIFPTCRQIRFIDNFLQGRVLIEDAFHCFLLVEIDHAEYDRRLGDPNKEWRLVDLTRLNWR